MSEFCPNCFEQTLNNGICSSCNFNINEYVPQKHHIKPKTLVQERYLVGKVISENDNEIIYYGYDTESNTKVAIKELYPKQFVLRDQSFDTVLVDGKHYEEFNLMKSAYVKNVGSFTKLDILPDILQISSSTADNNTQYLIITLPGHRREQMTQTQESDSIISIVSVQQNNVIPIEQVQVKKEEKPKTKITSRLILLITFSLLIAGFITAIILIAIQGIKGNFSVIPNSTSSHKDVDVTDGDIAYDQNGIEYSFDKATESYLVTGIGNCTKKRITFMREINGYPVTKIKNYAFQQEHSITEITIPEGITSIGNNAFANCSSLTTVTIPKSIKNTGAYTFFECTNLTQMYIKDGLEIVGISAFEGCTSLKQIDLPDTVIRINEAAFINSGITRVVMSDNLQIIEKFAFSGSNLNTISIPNSCRSIEEYAFASCRGLYSVDLGSGLTSIGNYAFNGTLSLTKIFIPSNVSNIGEYAFSHKASCLVLVEAKEKPQGWISNWSNSLGGVPITIFWGVTDPDNPSYKLSN